MKILDSLFSNFKLYRRLSGSAWYRYQNNNVIEWPVTWGREVPDGQQWQVLDTECYSHVWEYIGEYGHSRKCSVCGRRENYVLVDLGRNKAWLPAPYRFFIGGMDLEMVEIIKLLSEHRRRFENKNLRWGAKASSYGAEIRKADESGYAPVLIELELDCEVPAGAIIIDHHGIRSNEPAAILQVCELLGVKPSRWQKLVAANDVRFLHGLLEFGASKKEIEEIRADDRKVQGVTEGQEQQIRDYDGLRIESVNGINIAVADNLPHSRFAPIQDCIFVEGNADVLVCVHRESNEVNFYWYPELCRALHEKFPESYSGVQYWGSTNYSPDEVVSFIKSWLAENGTPEGVSQPSPRKR